MANACQSPTMRASEHEQSMTAIDSLGRLAREKSWGSSTTCIPSVDVIDGATRIELADRRGSSSYIDLGLVPDRSGVSERLPESVSVIVSHRLRSIECALVQLRGRGEGSRSQRHSAFLSAGCTGSFGGKPATSGDPSRFMSTDYSPTVCR